MSALESLKVRLVRCMGGKLADDVVAAINVLEADLAAAREQVSSLEAADKEWESSFANLSSECAKERERANMLEHTAAIAIHERDELRAEKDSMLIRLTTNATRARVWV